MLSLDSLVENSPLIVRFASAGTAILTVIGGLLNLFLGSSYAIAEIGILAATGGAVCVLSELSPFGLHHLLKAFPFLANQMGRGVLYLSVGILMMGSEFGTFSRIASSLLLVSGIANLVMFWYGPRHVGYVDTTREVSEFDNYAPI